jgi:hypothetical protein
VAARERPDNHRLMDRGIIKKAEVQKHKKQNVPFFTPVPVVPRVAQVVS